MKNGWPKLGGLLGIAYCIAGFFLVFLGWNGAASNDRVEAQIPYVISGGIAGLGLVVLGAALIVAHSLRADRVELKASIDDLRAEVARLADGTPDGDPTPRCGVRPAPGRPPRSTTSRRRSAQRPECSAPSEGLVGDAQRQALGRRKHRVGPVTAPAAPQPDRVLRIRPRALSRRCGRCRRRCPRARPDGSWRSSRTRCR